MDVWVKLDINTTKFTVHPVSRFSSHTGNKLIKETHLLFLLLLLQHYSPLRSSLVSITKHAHSVPSTVPVFHILTPIIIKSDPTSSKHLSLALPCLLPSPVLPSSNFFTVLQSLIFATNLIHSTLITLITDTKPGDLNLF